MNLGLRGRRALVTGGSRGVGRATALLLARAGADVGITYRARHEDAKRTVGELREQGARAWAHALELTEPAEVEALFQRCGSEWSALDIFVANAGVWVSEPVPLAEMDPAQWRRTLRINLEAVLLSLRLAARSISDGGRIVLVSSTAAQRGEAFHADYAASKGALLSLTKSLAVELATRGVTVNCVAPGWIDTEMIEEPMRGDGRERIERGIPLGRIASAEDVAGPIVFLCSALARHVTGEVLNVNGGSVLCG